MNQAWSLGRRVEPTSPDGAGGPRRPPRDRDVRRRWRAVPRIHPPRARVALRRDVRPVRAELGSRRRRRYPLHQRSGREPPDLRGPDPPRVGTRRRHRAGASKYVGLSRWRGRDVRPRVVRRRGRPARRLASARLGRQPTARIVGQKVIPVWRKREIAGRKRETVCQNSRTRVPPVRLNFYGFRPTFTRLIASNRRREPLSTESTTDDSAGRR